GKKDIVLDLWVPSGTSYWFPWAPPEYGSRRHLWGGSPGHRRENVCSFDEIQPPERRGAEGSIADPMVSAFAGALDQAGFLQFIEIGECDPVGAVAPFHAVTLCAGDRTVVEPVVAPKQQQQQPRRAA